MMLLCKHGANWETFNERKDAYKEFYDKQVKFCKERDEEFLEWQRRCRR